MSRTFINQSSQIGGSEEYNDSLPVGSGLQSQETLQGDLNALRSMLRQLINPEGNWYDQPTASLSELRSAFAELGTNLGTAEGSIATLQLDVGNLTTQQSNQGLSIVSLQTDVASVQTSVSTLETTVAAQATDVLAVETEVAGLQTQVATVQTQVSAVQTQVAGIETYAANAVYVDPVNGLDAVGRGSFLKPYRSINYAYGQVPSAATDQAKWVGEKLVINLAAGTYTGDVTVGWKRARVALVGEGVRIVGNVFCKALLADYPASIVKANNPAPWTGTDPIVTFDIAGHTGGVEGGLHSGNFIVTGKVRFEFEVYADGVTNNWESRYGMHYFNANNCLLVGGVTAAADRTNNAAFRFPPMRWELNEVSTSSAGRIGLEPFASETTLGVGQINLKAVDSSLQATLGPRIHIVEMVRCRVRNMDRNLANVTDGSISGAMSNYVGITNTVFTGTTNRIGSGTAGTITYRMDSNSYDSLMSRTLDVGAATMVYTLIDKARGVGTTLSPTNYSKATDDVEAHLTGINTALGLKANQTDLVTAQGSITTIQGQVSTLQTTSTTQGSAISTLQTDLTSAQGNITALQSSVTTVQGQVSALESASTSQGSAISTLQGDVSTLQSGLSSAEESISSIDIAVEGKVSRSGDTMSGSLSMNGNALTDLLSPTEATDAATKGYVDAVALGLKIKAPVEALYDFAGGVSPNVPQLPVEPESPLGDFIFPLGAHTSYTVTTEAELDAALAAAVDYDTIYVPQNTTITLTSTKVINKSLWITGKDRSTSVFLASFAVPANSGLFIVSGLKSNNTQNNNVVFSSLSITSTSNATDHACIVANTVSSANPNGSTGLVFDTLNLNHTEFGITVAADSWVIKNCAFNYIPSTGVADTSRHLGIYNIGTMGWVENCVFPATTEAPPAQRRTIAMLLTTASYDFAKLWDNGTTTGGNGGNKLNDTKVSWVPGQLIGSQVKITGGNGINQTRSIIANTDTEITVSANWTAVPLEGDSYEILSDKSGGFSGDFVLKGCTQGSGFDDGIAITTPSGNLRQWMVMESFKANGFNADAMPTHGFSMWLIDNVNGETSSGAYNLYEGTGTKSVLNFFDTIYTSGNECGGRALGAVPATSSGNKGMIAVDGVAPVRAAGAPSAVYVGDLNVGTAFSQLLGYDSSNGGITTYVPAGSGDSLNLFGVNTTVFSGLNPNAPLTIEAPTTGGPLLPNGINVDVGEYPAQDGDRIFVRFDEQSELSGIYVCSAGNWSYASDWTGNVESAFFFVKQGSYADTAWVQTYEPALVGQSPMVFSQFAGPNQYVGEGAIFIDGNVIGVQEGGITNIMLSGNISLDKLASPVYTTDQVDQLVTTAINELGGNVQNLADAVESLQTDVQGKLSLSGGTMSSNATIEFFGGTGLINGLATLTANSSPAAAVNKLYVDEAVQNVQNLVPTAGVRNSKLYVKVIQNVSAGNVISHTSNSQFNTIDGPLPYMIPNLPDSAFAWAYDVYVNGQLLRPGLDHDFVHAGTNAPAGLIMNFDLVVGDVVCVVGHTHNFASVL